MIYMCKMCGGHLDIVEGKSIAVCEYCGTKQTVPKVLDPTVQNLYNRANTLRRKGEFDSAAKIYETIVQADTVQEEAYWGLILCKYGIEYVDDPKTLTKIPTCHRTSYDSIIADEDYKSALEYADFEQRTLYEEQAKEIDRLQKEILALALKEETYDIFICYKETDDNGQRTQDSVIANDIYYQLTNEGYKVFYSAITLEGKLGRDYEPIIFAALNSAKIMLVVGTKPEYFNAVWVKNEWSRFLKIIQKDRSKLLIPCYRDMDAYNLPAEFGHLQAQDMSKIGFITDLVRGIKKVIVKNTPNASTTPVLNNTNVSISPTNTAPLLKRAYLSLEDGEWENADNFAEQVLNQDPECAEAYVIKLLVEQKLKNADSLANAKAPISNSPNYKKAIRVASPEYRKKLEAYNDEILLKQANARKDETYYSALSCMNNKLYDNAITIFQSLSGYRDSNEKLEECEKLKAIEAKKESNTDFQSSREHEQNSNTQSSNSLSHKNNNKKSKKAAIIIISIILVLAIFASCFILFSKLDLINSNSSKNNSTIEETKKENEEETPITISETIVKSLSNTAMYTGNILILDSTTRYKGKARVVNLYQREDRSKTYSILMAVRDKYHATEETAVALNKMLKAFYEAKKDDNLFISGAYDTTNVDGQDAIYSSGETIALSYFHDYATNGINDQRTIEGVDTYKWIYANAHKYGFIAVSSNSNEFRYIGVTHATAMKTKGLSFSNYLNRLKNATPESPMKLDESGSYVAYYCPISDVKVPTNYEYEISGNNVDGVIITVNVSKTTNNNLED